MDEGTQVTNQDVSTPSKQTMVSGLEYDNDDTFDQQKNFNQRINRVPVQ